MVEEYLEKQQIVSSFQDFLKAHDRNPLTKAEVLLAKNYDYTYQKSEESIIMLIPLSKNSILWSISSMLELLGEISIQSHPMLNYANST